MSDGIKAGELDHVDPDSPERAIGGVPGITEGEIEAAIQREAAKEAAAQNQPEK